MTSILLWSAMASKVRTRPAKPVEVEELKEAILRTIAREFGGRPLDRETAAQALALAAFDLNMLEIRAAAEAGQAKKPR